MAPQGWTWPSLSLSTSPASSPRNTANKQPDQLFQQQDTNLFQGPTVPDVDVFCVGLLTVSLFLVATNIFRHSKEDSTIASTATLSPVEQQKGFGQLSTINEKEPRAGGALSASTASMHEKDSSTRPQHSWLTEFLVDAHLSAPNRRQEVSSNGAPNTHAGSNSHHHGDSISSMDRV